MPVHLRSARPFLSAKTSSTTFLQRPFGGGATRAFRVALVLSLLIATFLATARNAAADDSAPPSPVAGAVADATTPAAPAAAVTAAQDASTTQGANGAAVAGDLSQTNAIGTSSDSGAVSATASQANTVTSDAAAANTAATSQTASQDTPSATQDGASTAPPPAPASGGSAGAQDTAQSANTTQNAGAVAAATGIQQINVIIIIRVNSPGDDVISQSNVVDAIASATNTATPTQTQGSLPTASGQQDGGSPEPGSEGSSPAPTGGSAGTAAPAAQSAVPDPVVAAERTRPLSALSAARASAGTLQLLAIAAAAARAHVPDQTPINARGVKAHSAPNRAPVDLRTSRPRRDVTVATSSSRPEAVAGAMGGSSATPPNGLHGHGRAASATAPAPAAPARGNASTAASHLAASAQVDGGATSFGLLDSLVVALLVGVLALAAMTFGPALTNRLRLRF